MERKKKFAMTIKMEKNFLLSSIFKEKYMSINGNE